MPIRGLWSLIVIVTMLLMTVILALADWWHDIFEAVAHSHVQLTPSATVAISLPLLVLWLVVVLFFDRRMYVVFSPGQLLVRQEIGSGEVAFDTTGMVVAKRAATCSATGCSASARRPAREDRRHELSAVRDSKFFCRKQAPFDPGHAPDARW